MTRARKHRMRARRERYARLWLESVRPVHLPMPGGESGASRMLRAAGIDPTDLDRVLFVPSYA